MEQQNLAGKVVETAGLVEYQDGSIVSRTIIDKSAGTLTLFAFDEDQALSEHTVPFDALASILDGEAEITISGEPNTVGVGQMVLMPANEPHGLRAVSRFKMMLVMIKS